MYSMHVRSWLHTNEYSSRYWRGQVRDVQESMLRQTAKVPESEQYEAFDVKEKICPMLTQPCWCKIKFSLHWRRPKTSAAFCERVDRKRNLKQGTQYTTFIRTIQSEFHTHN
jgi:hypothetical protein